MAMDVIQRTFAMPMRPYADSDDTISVRWYRVPDDTPQFPGEHAFGQMCWEGEYPDQFAGPRMLRGPLRLVKPNIPHPPGTHFHGQEEWYRTGIPFANRNDPWRNCVPVSVDTEADFTLDAECEIYVEQATGELAMEGECELPAGLIFADGEFTMEGECELPAGLIFADGEFTMEGECEIVPSGEVQVTVGVWNLDATGEDLNVFWDDVNPDPSDWWDPLDPGTLTPPVADVSYDVSILIEAEMEGFGSGIVFYEVRDEDDNVLWSGSDPVTVGSNTITDSGSIIPPGPFAVFVWSTGLTGNAAISFVITAP